MHIESCTFYMLTFTHRWRSIIRPGVYGSCVLRHGEPSGKPSLSFWNTPSLEECSTHLDGMAALTRIGKTWSGNFTGCWTEQVGLRHLKRVTSDIPIKNPPCGTTGANWTDWCHPDSIKEPFSHGKEAIDGAYTAAQEYEDKLSGKMNSQMMP